jgi:putative ABC transport system permease protein
VTGPTGRRLPGEALYRALLRLYPREFRARYGDDMAEFYRDRVRAHADAPRAVIRLWLRLFPDLITGALSEHAAGWSMRQSISDFESSHRREETMSVIWQDVRYALRSMVSRRGFSAVVLATLALGIGANAAIFSVVNTVLIRPLAYASVGGIVDFTHASPYQSVSEPEFIDYQRGLPAFSKLAGYSPNTVTVGIGDEVTRRRVSRVSRDFFPILGVQPMLGRVFAGDEFSHLNRDRLVVVSYAFWLQQLGGDTRVVGRKISLSGSELTIIGVMPPGFAFPDANTSFWTRWRYNPDSLWTRNNHYLRLVGRLAPNATIEQARAQAQTLAARWSTEFPETYAKGQTLVPALERLRDHVVGPTRPYLIALLGAVGFILLIACVNVANLMLVRGEARRKEFAIRAALGASRRRMIRQTITESMIYALAGAVLGMGVAWIAARFLVLLAPADVPRLRDLGVDWRVVSFTAAITIVTGLLFGLVPALRVRADTADTLRDGGKTSSTGGIRVARRALVVSEIALAVVMLTGAGLLIRSLDKLRAIDLGFDPARVLSMQLTLPPRGYTDTTADQIFHQIVERVEQLPGVETAAFEGAPPMGDNDSMWSIMIDGHVVKTIAESPAARPDQVTADFFKTMSVRIVGGRGLQSTDRMGSPPVVVINEAMAKTLWPGVNPVGHTLKMFAPTSPWVTFVGVASDVRARGYQGEIPPTMYFPYSQTGTTAYGMPGTMTLLVKARDDAAALAPSVRAVIRAAEARMPIDKIQTMDQVVGRSIASRTFTTVLLGAFAVVALLLAGLGIYGVIAYGVSQRRFEIGVRMALGASPRSVTRLVVGEGVTMAVVGLALGLVGAIGVLRLLRSLLVGVELIDAPTLAGVAVALAAVALCACAVPARRATAVSPTEALRNG